MSWIEVVEKENFLIIYFSLLNYAYSVIYQSFNPIDNVAEYFNQDNDWGGGNHAASKIWVIGAFDSVNNRYPLSFSIYGNPDPRVPPVTNVYIKNVGSNIYGDCDPSYTGPKDVSYFLCLFSSSQC